MPDLPEVPEDGQPAEPAERATDDELFAQLVADYDIPVDAEAKSWPDAEDVSDLAPQPRPRPAAGAGSGIIRLPVVRAIPPVDPRAWTPAEDPDEERYVPPPPPPLPQTETTTRLAVVAVVGGIALALATLFGQLPGMAAVLGVGLFVGGVATLVMRMREDDEDDIDPHNGAVV
ncbi:hypothetical protein [Streptacidiphilus sp. EB129]|uniref:hypothetical protein n=1 Tax=Streptacidiphilus sp. EB129 TaxID=3156262 RepID=UPI003518A178